MSRIPSRLQIPSSCRTFRGDRNSATRRGKDRSHVAGGSAGPPAFPLDPHEDTFMSRLPRPSRLVVASLALGVSLPYPAWAGSSRDEVLSITTQSLKASGAKEVTWGAVEGDDARFSVSNFKAVTEAEGKIGTLTVAKTTWTGAAPTPEGGIAADEVAAEGLGFEGDDAKIKADRLVLTKYRGPAPSKVVPGKISGERIDLATLSGVTITTEDGKSIPIATVSFSATDYVGDTPRKSSFEMKGLVLPLDPADSDVEPVRALGYEKVTIDASFSGTWDDKTGRLDVASLTVGAADMGTLKVAATVGGVTPEVVDALKKVDGDQTKQMEILQGLTVETLSLRWDDASLTGRVLDQQAKQQGVDSKTYAKQLKLLMPAMLSMIGNKEFEKKVAGATGSFLDQPKSLTVSARPKVPVPFGQLMGAAMAMPQTLPAVLGVEVVAND